MEQIPGKTITPESLEVMFTNIKNETGWDIGNNMLWGYFFTHNESSKLEQAADILNGKGYTIVDIYQSEKDNDAEPDMYWLHIEKIETHTPSSLDDRNNEFYMFAHEFGLDSYDGMDVGPVSQ